MYLVYKTFQGRKFHKYILTLSDLYNSRAVSPGGKSQDDKTTSEAEKSHQNGGKNGGNGSDKSMDLDDRSPSRHKSKKHKKFKQRSR